MATVTEQKIREHLRRYEFIAEGKCREWHKAIEDYERDYFLMNSGDVSDSTLPAVLTNLADVVNDAVNILTSADWEIHLDRPGMEIPDEQKAGLVSDFLQKVYKSVEERNSGKLITDIVQKLMRYGVAPVYTTYDNSVMTLPYAEHFTFVQNPPIQIYVLDPRNFYPVVAKGVREFNYVIHKQMYKLRDAMELAVSFDNAAGNTFATDNMVKRFKGQLKIEENFNMEYPLVDYWGWHYTGGKWRVVNAVAYGDVILRPFQVMDGYIRLPFTMATAFDTHDDEYVKRFLPITWFGRPHVRHAEYLQGMANDMLQNIVSTPSTVETTPEFPTPPDIIADNDFIVALPPGQRLTVPQYENIAPDIYRQLELAERRIDSATMPRRVGLDEGAASGYSFEKMQESARMALQPARISMQITMARVFQVVCSLIHEYHRDEVIYGKNADPRWQLRGADLMGWTIEVKWSSTLPGDELRNVTIAGQAVGQGLASRSTAMKRWLNIQDPQGEIERITIEQVMASHPAIAEQRAWQIIKEQKGLPDPNAMVAPVLQEAKQKAASAYQLAVASGAPPEEAEQIAEQVYNGFIQGAFQAIAGAVNPLQALGAPPINDMGGKNDKGSPDKSSERAIRNPEQGMNRPLDAGRPPAGNPADPANALREQLNQIRGA